MAQIECGERPKLTSVGGSFVGSPVGSSSLALLGSSYTLTRHEGLPAW